MRRLKSLTEKELNKFYRECSKNTLEPDLIYDGSLYKKIDMLGLSSIVKYKPTFREKLLRVFKKA